MITADFKRRTTSRFVILTLFALFLSGCATIKSGSHHDDSVSFERYRLFSWIADQPLIVGVGEPTHAEKDC